MGLWSKIKKRIRRWKMGCKPHLTMRCPYCKSRYVRGTYGNRFECCDCGRIFS